MNRSIEHVKFPEFQTGIFVEWKAPLVAIAISASCKPCLTVTENA